MSFEKNKLCTLEAEDFEKILPYCNKRYSHTCESVLLSHYIWKDFYHTQYVADEDGLIWVLRADNEIFTLIPLCDEADLKDYFYKAKAYFNDVLGIKLKLYLADEKAVLLLDLPEEEFEVFADRRYFDYIYDAEKLRTLSGRAYHKKKNHINAFKKAYEGRFEYRSLCCNADRQLVMDFLYKWEESRQIEDELDRIDYELKGIEFLMANCTIVAYKMGGIFIDGSLEAISIGVYGKQEQMAFIHVEKANPNINGLYAFINQQFLIHEFPDAKFVNREDDMGLEGLRKSKTSYNPIYLMPKYNIMEK